MGEITFYPEFVPNQVLTNTQLNQLRAHLDREERATRVRLFGTGIVCGLHWTVEAGGKALRLAHGFGIGSAGYLVALGGPSLDGNGADPDKGAPAETVFTHWRTYKDPDVAPQTKVLGYVPWRAPAGGQIDILELLDAAALKIPERAKGADALGVGALEGRVVVLYLEREPVNLNSCLVTDCDNKGVNIRLNPRVLLVKTGDLAKVADCGPAPKLIVLPRLHTRGKDKFASATDINEAYAAIVKEAAESLAKGIGAALEDFESVLGLEQAYGPAVAKVAEWIGTRLLASAALTQYHYDAAKDLACAYNEFVTAACALVRSCGADNGFPRHLLLGTLDAGTAGYRREFAPSAMRNLADDALQRLRKLFERILAMAEHLNLKPGGADVRLTPSHTEDRPLGARALPFYFPRKELAPLWQPRLCCTSQPLWSGEEKEETAGLDHQYPYCSFIRIEGHLGRPWSEAAKEIRKAQRAANAEFALWRADLRDPEEDEEKRLKEIGEIEAARQKLIAELTAFLAESLDKDAPLKDNAKIREAADEIRKREMALIESSRERGRARCARELRCDVGALEADYAQLRASVLCALHDLLGHLDKLAAAAPRIRPVDAGLARAKVLLPEIRTLAKERTAAALVAWRRTHAVVDEVLEAIDKKRAVAAEHPEILAPFTLWAAAEAARQDIEAYTQAYLPRRLCELEAPLAIGRHKELVSDLMRVLLLCALVEFVVGGSAPDAGAVVQPGAPGSFEWEDALAALRRAAADCAPARLAALASRYEEARRNDLSLFGNLAKAAPGLEHAAGVEKGGTFVLVCDPAGDIVADFSLSGRPPCCCRPPANPPCLPPVARPEYRVALLRRRKDGKGYAPLELAIDVLANDFEPNLDTPQEDGTSDPTLVIAGLQEQTDQGGSVKLTEDGRAVRYEHGDPAPGRVDRFVYTIESKDKACGGGRDLAEVLILMIPEMSEEAGAIQGIVYYSGDEPAGGAFVQIVETGASTQADKKGRFAFPGLKPASYTLQANLAQRVSGPVPVLVQAGAPTEVTLHLHSAIVAGNMTVAVRSAKPGKAIPGARVALQGDGQSEPVLRTADKAGAASFENLAPGKFVLGVAALGYKAAAEALEVTAGDNPEKQVLLELGRATRPASDAVVELIVSHGNLSQAKARALATETFERRYAARLAQLNEAGVAEDSKALAEAVKSIVETYSDPAPVDAGIIAAFAHFADSFAAEFAAADDTRKPGYRTLLAAVSLALLDRLVMGNPGNVSADAGKALKTLGQTLKKAEVMPAEIKVAWDGSALATQLYMGAAPAIEKVLQ